MRRSLHADQRGFSLAEVLVSMGVMLAVLAGTFQVMASAMKDTQTAKQVTNLNANLRSAMDVVVRDILQVGQGLPSRGLISVPNGPGTTLINRPGPAASGPCLGATRFPAGTAIPAVTSGPSLGPRIGTECTDVITTLAADGLLDEVDATVAANGSTATIDPADADITGGADGRANDLREGDLLMIKRGGGSALMYVTAVNDQTVTFGGGDPLNLNQFGNMLGTINRLIPPPGPPAPPLDDFKATRIRMITYYVDVTTDPLHPRVVRRIGNGPPNAIGVDVEKLLFTYDITDSVNNPTGVRLVPADFAAGGACGANPCSANQIRLVNITLAMRSRDKTAGMSDYHRNTLFTQVSARSLSFFDQYR